MLLRREGQTQVNKASYPRCDHHTECPGGKVHILGGHSIGHSKQKKKNAYIHVSYSERFPRWSYGCYRTH
jgi:hypothetical protein